MDEPRYLLADAFVGVLNVAAAKALAVTAEPEEVVLAGDTTVVAEGQVVGKPEDAPAAREMLSMLRGRPHDVLSGVVLRRADGRQWGAVVGTRVVMRPYTDVDIEQYVARGEPFDKAGGYAVQDAEFAPVERVEACYLNVVGLPLCAVSAGLNALGIPARAAGAPPCDLCRAGEPLVSIRSGS